MTPSRLRDTLEDFARRCREALGCGEARPRYDGPSLAGAHLTGAYLRDASLAYADLTGADLTGADLTGANLTGADLTDADLRGAHLTYADLTDAHLTGAYLTDADLRDADLTGADLTGANLTGADLTDADLTGANLTGAVGLPLTPEESDALRREVADQIENHPEAHEQSAWHSECGTSHCAAGWTTTKAGSLGRHLERQYGCSAAAHLLLGGSVRPSFASDAKRDEIILALREGIEVSRGSGSGSEASP
jgi:uncharacterized protein YjbI with pentapeptide repeats